MQYVLDVVEKVATTTIILRTKRIFQCGVEGVLLNDKEFTL